MRKALPPLVGDGPMMALGTCPAPTLKPSISVTTIVEGKLWGLVLMVFVGIVEPSTAQIVPLPATEEVAMLVLLLNTIEPFRDWRRIVAWVAWSWPALIATPELVARFPLLTAEMEPLVAVMLPRVSAPGVDKLKFTAADPPTGPRKF